MIRSEKKILVEEREMEATLNTSSVVGINTPKTMKVLRMVKGKKAIVLLDRQWDNS